MKALVFNNFSEELYERDLKPKLEDLGVTVVRTCVPDRVNAHDVDFTEVDAIVVFKFLMSHGQFDQINRRAKQSKKPCVGLDRQSSKWGDVLRPIMTAVARREAAISPGLPVVAPANEPHESRGPGRASADTIRYSLTLFKDLTLGEAEEGVIIGALEPWRRFKSLAEVEEAVSRVVATAGICRRSSPHGGRRTLHPLSGPLPRALDRRSASFLPSPLASPCLPTA